ncbi:MAG TPA: hypothetical protein VM204_05270 [Gaiellaceae bacterium]|nr:hypothetical protein [Gaiellaceae bacterium]
MRHVSGSGIRRTAAVVAAALVAFGAFGAGSARAGEGLLGLSCGYDPSHPFLRWLDPLPYVLAPNGGLENGASGWKLAGGAKVASGNSPFNLSGAGSRSLYLPAGSSATSPRMCVELTLPVVRFVSKGGGLLTGLKVEGVYTDVFGNEQSLVLLPGALPSSSWQPTLPLLQLGGLVNALTLNGTTTEMSFRFTPVGLFGGGDWYVDEVFVDPWKRT